MNEWTIYPSIQNHNQYAIGSPRHRGQRRGMTVEILLGGFRIPGVLEYGARGDQVTFTITNAPHAAPGELEPEPG